MTMQSKPPLTAAEQKLFESFEAVRVELPGKGPVAAMRERLLSDLRTAGLPTRRIEAWHYTDLRSLLRSVPGPENAGAARDVPALVERSAVLAVRNGVATDGAGPAGVATRRFRDMLSDEAVVTLLKERGADDAIGKINGAFVSDGLTLSLADGTVLEHPLEIQHLQNGGQAHTRLPVQIGRDVKATIIERHIATGDAEALASAVTDLSVGEGAELIWIILQQRGRGDTHLGQINVRLGAGAKLMLYVVNAGGHLVRQEIRAVVEGEGADMKLRGINLLGGASHTDVTLVLGHNVPETTSTEIVRNVVFDRARGVFQGQIRVAPDAQKTDARMACNTLLLSDDGDFSTKPELEIFADDVQCGHGATVADIDQNHLFYMMARGVPEKKARAMLVNAFVAEIVEELQDEALIEALEGVIARWLEAHA
ncbi:MAG: Fe-S cluster assembly protein SufD [Pararhizobium sp.]